MKVHHCLEIVLRLGGKTPPRDVVNRGVKSLIDNAAEGHQPTGYRIECPKKKGRAGLRPLSGEHNRSSLANWVGSLLGVPFRPFILRSGGCWGRKHSRIHAPPGGVPRPPFGSTTGVP